MKKILSIFIFLFSVLNGLSQSAIHHTLIAEVKPESHSISVKDTIKLPATFVSQGRAHFYLHENMNPVSMTEGVTVKKRVEPLSHSDFNLSSENFHLPSYITLQHYDVELADGVTEFTLSYTGEIYHPVEQKAEEYARSFSETPGIISEKGVYLSSSSCWLPVFGKSLLTFELTTILPEKWDSVSQGSRSSHDMSSGKQITVWTETQPQDDIYLIAGQFTEYSRQVGRISAMAFLRTPDDSLAEKYLETTAQYLQMYVNLIGRFPYGKFALVENFWETGYGMPSFTLLGEKVIRFPFILHSSYPHELLHNWWGNSVYVDYKTGNWCEGITAYMADHLISEQRKKGDDYRRTTLQRFTNYVTPENDFPLSKFINRTDAATEAVGYGKSLMMVHMLRMKLGNEMFIKAVQHFYKNNSFKQASFDDFRLSCEAVSSFNLSPYFNQWVKRKGAPELLLENAAVEQTDSGYILKFDLKQIQHEDVFNMDVPVAVVLEGEANAHLSLVTLNSRRGECVLEFKSRPVLIKIDPEFDVMRRLDPYELPPSLSGIFGSKEVTIILPSEDSLYGSYMKLAQLWSKSQDKTVHVVKDSELKILPDHPFWVFGINNTWKQPVADQVKSYGVEFTDNSIKVSAQEALLNNNSIVFAARHPDNASTTAAFLHIGNDEAFSGLSRKLPHYGKYSYLAFEGSEPDNFIKGIYPVLNSPLEKTLSDISDLKCMLPERSALAEMPPVFNENRMMTHIQELSSENMEGRGFGSKGLEKSAAYIANAFKQAGLIPTGDNGSFFQTFSSTGGNGNVPASLKNIVGMIKGTNPDMNQSSVLICAHYDHLGLGWPDVRKGNEGKIHPGADDNASGVSVMIELASILSKSINPSRTIVFAAFAGEECGLKGSRYYAEHMKEYPTDKIIGVVNLDTVGRLFDNKLLVIGGGSAREWKHIFMGSSYVTGVETSLVSEQLDSSDQTVFIEKGVPGIQLFSGPHPDYHRPSDTADKIDPSGLVKVATITKEILVYLSERPESLDFTGEKKNSGHPTQPTKTHPGKKRAGTGNVPDFSFSGNGVKISDVLPDSPAMKAGIQKGDIIISIDGISVSNLKDYSNVLKTKEPGNQVEIILIRNEKELTVSLTLAER